MRALRFCGLVLAVLAAHLVAWRIAVAGWPRFALARAGVRWIEIARMPRRIGVTVVAADGARDHPSMAPPSLRADPATAPRKPEPKPKPEPALAPAFAPAPGSTLASALPRPPGHLSTGTAGTVRTPEPDTPTWPVYPTHAPPSTRLHYVLVQGGARTPEGGALATGEADIAWTLEAAAFSLRVATTASGHAPREWRSAGTLDAAGIAPQRLVESERGRDKRAVNFDHDQQQVRFSGATQALPLAPGAQDRWSWIAQLAAIAEAATEVATTGPPSSGGNHPARSTIPAGTTWEIQVAGLRGELDRWVFRVLADTRLPADAPPHAQPDTSTNPDPTPPPGTTPDKIPRTPAARNEPSTAPDQAPALLHVLREPERPYDLRIEAWLSPSVHHLPIGLRMSAPPGSWSLALWPEHPSLAVSSP